VASPPDVVAELQATIDELIDLVLEVKQAHHAVPEDHPLHRQLDALFGELSGWTHALADRTRALGGSLLEAVTTVAGHRARNLFPSATDDADVALALVAPLRAAAEHATTHAATAAEVDPEAGAVFADVAAGLAAYVSRLEAVAR
jgi:DNA-binding ferritin-like protein